MSTEGLKFRGKRAYLVTGPESAGNRMVAAILSEAGCYGEGSTSWAWNRWELPDGTVEPVVVIRSQPHGNQGDARRGFVSVFETVALLVAAGYETTVLVTHRDPVALTRSQVARGHVQDELEAVDNVRDAYLTIYGELAYLSR